MLFTQQFNEHKFSCHSCLSMVGMVPIVPHRTLLSNKWKEKSPENFHGTFTVFCFVSWEGKLNSGPPFNLFGSSQHRIIFWYFAHAYCGFWGQNSILYRRGGGRLVLLYTIEFWRKQFKGTMGNQISPATTHMVFRVVPSTVCRTCESVIQCERWCCPLLSPKTTSCIANWTWNSPLEKFTLFRKQPSTPW